MVNVDAIVVMEVKVSHERKVIERFYNKISFDDCWIWNGAIRTSGYGAFNVQGKNCYAHRISYEIHVGEIIDNLFVLHSCDNRKCVNPDHLFLGTHQDNMADMNKKGRHFSPWSGKIHCKMGHKFTENNIYWRTGKTGKKERVCKICNSIWINKTKETK